MSASVKPGANPAANSGASATEHDPRRAIRRLNMIGLAVVVVLVGGVGGWATTAQLSGAVPLPLHPARSAPITPAMVAPSSLRACGPVPRAARPSLSPLLVGRAHACNNPGSKNTAECY